MYHLQGYFPNFIFQGLFSHFSTLGDTFIIYLHSWVVLGMMTSHVINKGHVQIRKSNFNEHLISLLSKSKEVLITLYLSKLDFLKPQKTCIWIKAIQIRIELICIKHKDIIKRKSEEQSMTKPSVRQIKTVHLDISRLIEIWLVPSIYGPSCLFWTALDWLTWTWNATRQNLHLMWNLGLPIISPLLHTTLHLFTSGISSSKF